MATMGSSLLSGNQGGITPIRRNGPGARKSLAARFVQISLWSHGLSFLVCRRVHSSKVHCSLPAKRDEKTGDNVPASAPQPTKRSKPTYPPWFSWILQTMVSLLVPSWKSRVMMFLKLEEEVEKAVENTAEAVEKMAEVTEKVISEVEEDLPADGKLKDALSLVEHAAEEAKKDAKIAEKVVHEVDELKEEVEKWVEPEAVKKQA